MASSNSSACPASATDGGTKYPWLRPLVTEQGDRNFVHRRAVVSEVLAPCLPAVGQIDARQKRRNDLAQLGEHEVRVRPGLGQRMGAHPQEEHLVALAGAVDPDV